METPKQRPGRNGGTLQTGFKNSEEAAKAARAKKQIPELKEIAANALSEEKGGITAAEKILRAHVKQAEAGDVASANFVFGYAYGKPTQKLEHTGEEGRVPNVETDFATAQEAMQACADDRNDCILQATAKKKAA